MFSKKIKITCFNQKKNNNKNIKKELLYQAILLKLNEDSINNIS